MTDQHLDEDEIEDMINDCLRREQKLNDHEKEFINDISGLPSNFLSKKQIEYLEKIWDRIT